jgi:hypothetical protein
MIYVKTRDSHPLYPTFVPMSNKQYALRVATVFAIISLFIALW